MVLNHHASPSKVGGSRKSPSRDESKDFLKKKGLSMDRNFSSLSLKPKVPPWQFLSSIDEDLAELKMVLQP
jgi:hypothetical protein